MINREMIRLKVVQLIYAYYQNEGKAMDMAEKELMFSFSKAYDLYLYLLDLLVEMKRTGEKKEETVRARNRRTGVRMEGFTQDGRFAANLFLSQLEENKTLLDFREKRQTGSDAEEAFVRKLYAAFVESEIFQLYITKEDFSYEADREVIRKLYKTYVVNNGDFDDLLEEQSLYWNDDKHIVDSFVLKTIKRFDPANGSGQELLPDFAEEEDRLFAITLFRQTLERADEVRALIRDNCKNWEFGRLAFMDVIIMQTALAEILSFPAIPVSVTFNEYLNMAKIYSTPRSASYINGLLDHVVRKLREDNLLMKS